MADILAKEAFDALTKLLHAINVLLIHFPLSVWTRRKRRDFAVYLVVPGDIGYEVFDHRKRFHRPDSNGLVQRQRVHARLASQTRAAIYLRRTRATFSGFAVPTN